MNRDAEAAAAVGMVLGMTEWLRPPTVRESLAEMVTRKAPKASKAKKAKRRAAKLARRKNRRQK